MYDFYTPLITLAIFTSNSHCVEVARVPKLAKRPAVVSYFISPRVSMSNRLQWLQYGLQRQITTDFVKKHFPCKRIIKACSLHRFESVRRSEFNLFIFFVPVTVASTNLRAVHGFCSPYREMWNAVAVRLPQQTLERLCHNASVNSSLSVAACVPDGWWPDGSPFRTSQGFQQDMWYTADCFVAC